MPNASKEISVHSLHLCSSVLFGSFYHSIYFQISEFLEWIIFELSEDSIEWDHFSREMKRKFFECSGQHSFVGLVSPVEMEYLAAWVIKISSVIFRHYEFCFRKKVVSHVSHNWITAAVQKWKIFWDKNSHDGFRNSFESVWLQYSWVENFLYDLQNSKK